MEDTTALLAKVAQRAETDPDTVLPVLRVLAGQEPYAEDGSQDLDAATMAVVLRVNRARVLADRADFREHAWTAEQVAEHLGVGSRQAVAQRRQRGTLVGAKLGTQTFYPQWQFGPDGLADGLGRLLELLRGAGVDDAREADSVLRMKHSELRRGTLLATWRRGEWGTVETWLGDVAGWRR